jgi:uncharacterized protein YggE
LFGCVNAYFSDEMIMTNYKWLLILTILLSNAVFAEDGEHHHQEPVINVIGHAELLVPADVASLTISARITSKTAKEAEAKGYQVGLKLKEVFKSFGIDEAALTNSNHHLDAEIFDNKQQYVFNLDYNLDFGRFDLIDSLREKTVEAGATAFNISGLITSHAAENKTKVRGLAYLDAKQKAEGLLSQSGFKLGKPLLIDDQRSDFPVYASARMLSDAVAPNVEPKAPLLENRNIRFEQEIRVKFKIVE